MSNIKFSNVHKSFGQNKIINNFNLEGKEDEFLVLVGPSGCGKSTLLRMIAGLEKVDEGKIQINDKIINELHPSKRETAMVFQSYALYPHMNVYENMSFGLKIEKQSKDEIQTKLQPTSFLSRTKKYIYHFGLMDYSTKYDSVGCLKKRSHKNVEAYKNSFLTFIEKNLSEFGVQNFEARADHAMHDVAANLFSRPYAIGYWVELRNRPKRRRMPGLGFDFCHTQLNALDPQVR